MPEAKEYIAEYSAKTYSSSYISKSGLQPNEVQEVENDIHGYNTMKRTAYSMTANKKALPQGYTCLQTYLQDTFQNATCQFARSAVNEAVGIDKSRKELAAYLVGEMEVRIEELDAKIKEYTDILSQLTNCKDSLIRRSKARKAGKKRVPKATPGRKTDIHFKPDGSVEVGKNLKFANEYLFETQYLNQEIRRVKMAISNMKKRREGMVSDMEKLKAAGKQNICFGSRKLFKAQWTKPYIPHDEWKKSFNKKRNHAMQIAGRHDAAGGNFVFTYNPATHILTYKTMAGRLISFPCEFKHGQKEVDEAVSRGTDTRQSVAWTVVDCGSAFLIQCTIKMEKPKYKNYYYGGGCIGADINADCITIAETDQDGNLLNHKTFPFNVRRKSSGQVTQILSNALDEVFQACKAANKPLVMEDIKNVQSVTRYNGKRLNEVLSMFAYQKMRMLAESKSDKYGIEVCFVNPQYTSQIGKMKYMRKYGLAVHEAAAFVIARRGMGFEDKVTGPLKYFVADKPNRSRLSQWKGLYSGTSMIEWKKAYRPLPAPDNFKNAASYAYAYMHPDK